MQLLESAYLLLCRYLAQRCSMWVMWLRLCRCEAWKRQLRLYTWLILEVDQQNRHGQFLDGCNHSAELLLVQSSTTTSHTRPEQPTHWMMLEIIKSMVYIIWLMLSEFLLLCKFLPLREHSSSLGTQNKNKSRLKMASMQEDLWGNGWYLEV